MAGADLKGPDLARLDASLRALGNPDSSQALPLFRAALREGRDALHAAYLNKAPIDTLLHRHAVLVDELLARVWAIHQARVGVTLDIALVAVGGYGRGELHPHSDVDLLLLLKRDEHARAQPFAEAFLQFLWDLGLDVGHSVRSLKECVREAKKDVTVATNLMEARLLQGDPALFAAMQAGTGPSKLWPAKKFFAAKHAEQIARHRRFDDTAYNLEPNIKEGPGGLRDIQMIVWVTLRQYGSARLHELVTHGFLTEKEFRALERGRRLLSQIRCGLHYLAGRREDRLLFDHQRALAATMGFRDKRGSRAVELFMKRYYRTIKELSLLNEILLQHFQDVLHGNKRLKIRPLNRRFQAHGDFLEVTRRNVFERSPFALLELFLVMQQHPELKGVRAATIRLLRESLHHINTRFRRDLACRSLFMEILRQPQGITRELRRMNAYGVLGAYLPVFGRVVGQMQHDLFHVYTVDEHTLFVVRNLRRFTVPEYRHEFPFASELIQRVVKPERLILAGLFHDIAKGRGGDHSELGEHDVIAFCRQHGLSDYDTRFIAWLVRHHLLMSHVAQRQDIQDPEVVLEFARRVGDTERLDHLYLLTVADMRATSPNVWNVWKDRLLTQLHAVTARALHRGLAEPQDAATRLADLHTEALARLKGHGIAPESARQHWSTLDPDYFLKQDAASIAWHTEQIVQAPAAGLPLVATRHHPDGGGTEFLIYTPDRDDLFAVITGGLDRLNLTIMGARIHTTRNGLALDSFIVLDHAMQPVTQTRELRRLATSLRDQLLNPRPGRDFNQVNLPRTLKHFPIATRVGFNRAAGGRQTLLEVTTQDRPGLLYQVALALQHCRVRLIAAKVATYGARAEDFFFVTDRDGKVLNDPQQTTCLEQELTRRLAAGLAAAASEVSRHGTAD